MRHHVHCQNHHGVVGYYPQHNNVCSINEDVRAEIMDSKNIVERHTQFHLGGESSISHFTKYQLDVLAYSFPHHMHDNDIMRPIDCQDSIGSISNRDTIDYIIKQFNLRNPLIQLRFNVRGCYHQPSYFLMRFSVQNRVVAKL